MKYISLFAGIGGFDLALNRLGHECVYANDFDKYCKITYDKNFRHKANDEGEEAKRIRRHQSSSSGIYAQRYVQGGLDTTSITEVDAKDIPDHDLLVGGFPCQAFSIAGKRGGFDDTRGTLFFDVARILKEKQPRLFILENVKGLLSHDTGRTFKTIISTLVELGYDLQWQVLNSKNFGVPQNRERVYIIGHLRGTSRPQVFPIRGSNKEADEKFSSTALDSNYWKGIDNHGQRTAIAQRFPLKFLQRNQRNINGNYAYTVDGANTGGIMKDLKIRRLTPIECERLQGFPDNWTEGVSDTQRYKQLGNAVTVNVVEEIARRLI